MFLVNFWANNLFSHLNFLYNWFQLVSSIELQNVIFEKGRRGFWVIIVLCSFYAFLDFPNDVNLGLRIRLGSMGSISYIDDFQCLAQQEILQFFLLTIFICQNLIMIILGFSI